MDDLAAGLALPQAFVFVHVIFQPGERGKAPVADRAVNFLFFLVFVAGHVEWVARGRVWSGGGPARGANRICDRSDRSGSETKVVRAGLRS